MNFLDDRSLWSIEVSEAMKNILNILYYIKIYYMKNTYIKYIKVCPRINEFAVEQ